MIGNSTYNKIQFIKGLRKAAYYQCVAPASQQLPL